MAFVAIIALTGLASAPRNVLADEGGVSFWLPGIFGSLAAAPLQPGWSVAATYYHTSVSAGGDVALSREFSIGKIPLNLSANLSASLDAKVDIGLLVSSYTFATPLLGGQATVGLMGIYGHNSTSLAGTLTGTLTLPGGGVIPFSRSDSFSDSLWGFGDLYPQFSLRWNNGVHNYMTYVTGDIPVGAYDSTRLANIGVGHGALDAGGGYTYLNPQTGHELSAVLGFTYNFVNEATQYQNGVDMHLDWGASQFLSKQLLVGAVGYVYKEIAATAAPAITLAASSRKWSGSVPKSGLFFRSGICRGISISKATRNSRQRSDPMAGTPGSHWRFRPAAKGRRPHSRRWCENIELGLLLDRDSF